MINEIYVSGNELKTIDDTYPRKQFNGGYNIKCHGCEELIARKWLDRKIFKEVYTCKSCVLKTNNPMHTEEGRAAYEEKRYSEGYLKANRDRDVSGENNPFYGKTHSKETIERLRQISLEQWAAKSAEERKRFKEQCSLREKRAKQQDPDRYSAMKRKAGRASHKVQFDNMEMNSIERKVSEYLNDDFEFSVILNKWQFDFGCKEKKILIEVDGDYWHGNPEMYNEDGSGGKRKLNHIQLKKKKKDRLKQEWAESRGFTVIRIWEKDINEGTLDVLKDYSC